MAVDLLGRIQSDRSISINKDRISIMLIPFTNADTAEVLQISHRIESIIITEGTRKFKDFNISRFTSKNIGRADYLINGTIRMDSYPGEGPETDRKYYRIYGEATD